LLKILIIYASCLSSIWQKFLINILVKLYYIKPLKSSWQYKYILAGFLFAAKGFVINPLWGLLCSFICCVEKLLFLGAKFITNKLLCFIRFINSLMKRLIPGRFFYFVLRRKYPLALINFYKTHLRKSGMGIMKISKGFVEVGRFKNNFTQHLKHYKMNTFKLIKYYKIAVLMIFLICTTNIFTAQPWEDKTYTHANSFLSTGRIAINNATLPGFLMAGYRITSTATTPNFYVERTGDGGYYPASSNSYSFSSSYTIQGQQNCSGTPNANNCVGVSVIEENVAGGGNYAITGAFSDGVFFSMLNAAGTPVAASMLFWPFPSGVTGVSKPLIVASTVADQYYITGSYNQSPNGRRMYMLKVTAGGAVYASMEYNIAGNIGMTPKGILMSPYGSANEIVVVGAGDDITGSASFLNKGFFALFDTTTLNNNSCYVYGQTPGTPLPDDQFQSLTIGNHNNSFIVGGYTNLYPATFQGNLWTLDINANGATTNWNNVQFPAPNNSAKNIVDIVERYSSTLSHYMYFAVVGANTSGNNMMVIKLDDNGLQYSSTANNEFYYRTSGVADGASISFLDNNGTGNVDEGIHIFGTDDNINGGLHFFVEATFNGVEGCSSTTLVSSSSYSTGPNNINSVGVNNLSGLSTCGNFNLVQAAVIPTVTYICGSTTTPPTPPLGGSMAKQNLSVGINTFENENTILQIYPNPVQNKLQLHVNDCYNCNINVQIIDCIGCLIIDQNQTLINNTMELNLSNFHLKSGIYFLSVNINGIQHIQKFNYTND